MKLRFLRIICCAVALIFFLYYSSSAQQSQNYHVLKSYQIGGTGGWDYIAVNPSMHRLYVSHSTKVHVLNENTGKIIGEIPNTNGVHGIAFVPDLHKGFISDGRADQVTVFDLKTNKVLDSIKTGKDPDAIMYDAFSKKIFVCDGHSSEATVIDPATDKVVTTIPLDGKPETAVSDNAGNIYVNIEDKSELTHINVKTFKVIESWPIGKGESPSGLAIDTKHKRLFMGCDNQLMIIMNAEKGNVIAQLPIGKGCDGTAYDPKNKLAFSSNGDGTLTIVKEDNPGQFHVIANVPTKTGARTLTVNPDNGRIYLPTAEFKEMAPGAHGRPEAKEGSFQVLVVGK